VTRLLRVAPSRLLGAAIVGLGVAAAVLWGSSRLTWLTATWDTSLRGRVDASATGAATEPVLVPWALLALAAIAGLLATSGWGRRVVGALLVVAGLWVVLQGAGGLAPPAPGALPAVAQVPGRPVGVDVAVAGPILAAIGGLLLGGVGLLMVLAAPVLPRLGARYDAPTEKRPPTADRRPDPDQQLWKALDEGRDPTATPPHATPDPPADRDAGSTPRAPDAGSDRPPRGDGVAG